MVASVEVSLLASIEALKGEELSSIVASFEPEEMMALMAEIDEEIGEDSSGATTVESWTPDDEWAAEQDELDRFDGQGVWTLTPRDPNGPKPLTWVWVKERRSGELKARLCLRPFGKRVTRSKNELYCPTPLSYSLKLLLVYAVCGGEGLRDILLRRVACLPLHADPRAGVRRGPEGVPSHT